MARTPKTKIQIRIVDHGEEDPTQLLANPQNFRRHPTKQLEALRGALRDVGWIQSVVVNKRTGHLIDGHARVEEAMRQNLPKVPVTYVDLSPEQEAWALLSFDKISELASEDDEVLAGLLQGIEQPEDPGLRNLLLEMEGEPPDPVTVKEVEVSEVTDRFWMSVRGPMPQQIEALERLRVALEELGPDVEVDVGMSDG